MGSQNSEGYVTEDKTAFPTACPMFGRYVRPIATAILYSYPVGAQDFLSFTAKKGKGTHFFCQIFSVRYVCNPGQEWKFQSHVSSIVDFSVYTIVEDVNLALRYRSDR